jgi:hypothetical protein
MVNNQFFFDNLLDTQLIVHIDIDNLCDSPKKFKTNNLPNNNGYLKQSYSWPTLVWCTYLKYSPSALPTYQHE